jgi:hypothetical protein
MKTVQMDQGLTVKTAKFKPRDFYHTGALETEFRRDQFGSASLPLRLAFCFIP